MDLKKLCEELICCDSEEEAISTLTMHGLWEEESYWKTFGDLENNFSIIGNQQAKPESALVEKIVNSIDAMLMRECQIRKIDPEGDNAPPDMQTAAEIFFGVTDGSLVNVLPANRRDLAKNIVLMSTGSKERPCFTLVDQGEGQRPENFLDTFLSIARTNKIKIPFVQGKFNSGGTGSLQFCGKKGLQLIVSRRDPILSRKEIGNQSPWGFTVVRKFAPRSGYKSSEYKYLSFSGKIPTFVSEELKVLPGTYPKTYEGTISFGTIVKMYDYNIGASLRSNILFDLYNRLSLLMPGIVLPVLLAERRTGYKGHTFETVLSGLSVRLDEDKRDNLENGFPDSGNLRINNQDLGFKIYVFKIDGKRKYATSEEGIIFVVNGQTHGALPETFFTRKAVDLSYLKNSLLVVVDCSFLESETREQLIMNSRDRLREGEFLQEIERRLQDELKEHIGLRALKEARRREEIRTINENFQPVKEVLNDLISNSPVLSQVLKSGKGGISDPFNLSQVGTQTNFQGKVYPTFFEMKEHKTIEDAKNCHINRRFRIKVYTDAENEYFERENDPGTADLYIKIGDRYEPVTDWSMNLWNGVCNLNVKLPIICNVADIIHYLFTVDDSTKDEAWEIPFYIKVLPEDKGANGGTGKRIDPSSNGDGDKQQSKSELKLPNIMEVYKEEWDRHSFTKYSAIDIKKSEGDVDIFVNMDNVYLASEIKKRTGIDVEGMKTQYKFSLALFAISYLALPEERETEEKENDEGRDISMLYKSAQALAMVLIPVLTELPSIGQKY